MGMYAWSYRRHKIRLLETPIQAQQEWGTLSGWFAKLADRVMPDPRVSHRSRSIRGARHRAHLRMRREFGPGARVSRFRRSNLRVASSSHFRAAGALVIRSGRIPLSLSPTRGAKRELGLRICDSGNREVFLQAVERFLLYWSVASVFVLTLPLELRISAFSDSGGVPASAIPKDPVHIILSARAAAPDRKVPDLGSQRCAIRDNVKHVDYGLSRQAGVHINPLRAHAGRLAAHPRGSPGRLEDRANRIRRAPRARNPNAQHRAGLKPPMPGGVQNQRAAITSRVGSTPTSFRQQGFGSLLKG